MGAAVEMSEPEAKLVEQITALLDESMAAVRKNQFGVELADRVAKMGDLAHRLHQSLASRGIQPRHHKHMLKNRRLSVNDPKFYHHIHPVQDLLKFVRDTSANDDPADLTMNHEFTFSVYSRRWGHEDTYRLKRTASGWTFRHFEEQVCDKAGAPGLFEALDHDSINYPRDLGGYLEYLWEQAAEAGLTPDQVQAALTTLSEWAAGCERASPDGLWTHYK